MGRSSGEQSGSDIHLPENGLLSAIQQKNGVQTSFTLDGSRVTKVKDMLSSAVLNTYEYGYDLNSNLQTRSENGTQHGFTYDKLNRIDTSTLLNEKYTYDARGNRQTLQSDGLPNLQAVDYQYDDRNRLTKVTTAAGIVVSYKYNGDGLLWERTENGSTTRYYYDGADVIAEGTVTAGVSALQATYIRGNGLIARADASGTKAYYLHNAHGDVTGLRDSSGNVLNTYSYDIWGNLLTNQESVPQPFRYSGELWDSTTSLQYLRARWYDPSMGRFINEDTYEGEIDNPLSLNLYTYVHNNPLTNVDPTGHMGRLALNTLSAAFNRGGIYNFGIANTDNIAAMVFMENIGNGDFYTSFHEIAQLYVAKKLYDIEKQGPLLEVPVSNGDQRGEIDIKAANGRIWEVKSGMGEGNPESQLGKYLSWDSSLSKGGELGPIKGVHVFADWKMDIYTIGYGHVYYFLYNSNDDDGNPIYQPLGYPERVIREKVQKAERAGVQAGAAANPAGAAAGEGAAAAASIFGKVLNWVKGLLN